MQFTDVQANSGAGMLDVGLYDRFAPIILHEILQQVAHPQDAEDLLLEVFVAALQSAVLEQLPPERQLAWLRRVARNKIIDRYRHLAALTTLPLEYAQMQEDQELTPEQYSERQERLDWLAHALVQLSPDMCQHSREDKPANYSKGSSTQKVLPLLGSDSHQMRPLWRSTMSLVMARPRPRPRCDDFSASGVR